MQRERWLPLPATLAALGCVEHAGPVLDDTPRVPTVEPIGPIPSGSQLSWQRLELTSFLHFGLNTFDDQEYGDGTVSPALFAPTGFDATQWMTTLRNAGIGQAMLTAKHHDGFCLWPTRCTSYSVAGSQWLGGQGDVVRKFVDAAHQASLRVGLALSPWDLHEPSFGTTKYQAVFECQLTELLTNYGSIDEIWFWDVNTPPEPLFNWNAIYDLVGRLQPSALIETGAVLAVAGSDMRVTSSGIGIAASVETSVQTVNGTLAWSPAESPVSIRPGWFWHATEDTQLKTLNELIDIYYGSVGQNSVLLLAVPPNAQGVLAAPDVALVEQYGAAIRAIYQNNVAAARTATADSVFQNAANYAPALALDGKVDTYWAADVAETTGRLEVDMGAPQTFNVINLQEPIALGERVTTYHVEARSGGTWSTIATGTTIGERKLHRVGAVTADAIALVIEAARGSPAIAELGVYESPFP